MATRTLGVKNIIIMGTGRSLVFCDFNYKDGKIIEDSEIYGVNGAYTTPRVMPDKLKPFFHMDKLFMGDTLFSFESGTLNFHIGEMNKFADEYNCELISVSPMKLGKHTMNSTRYPYNKISKYFGTEFFTDTVTYMIAYALYSNSHLAISPEGVTRPELDRNLRLRLFGIDMCTTQEYQQSKGGVEHWLGVARGMGAEITVCKGSSIFSNPYGVPYGFWHRLKWRKKDYDPLGLMKGKEWTTATVDSLIDKMEREMGEKGEQTDRTPDEQWGETTESVIIDRHS